VYLLSLSFKLGWERDAQARGELVGARGHSRNPHISPRHVYGRNDLPNSRMVAAPPAAQVTLDSECSCCPLLHR
jgi:hypothetical protein